MACGKQSIIMIYINIYLIFDILTIYMYIIYILIFALPICYGMNGSVLI